MSYKIGSAQNNSAPFDRNLDLLEVFSRKTTPLKGPILVLISQIFYPYWSNFALYWRCPGHPMGPFFVAPMIDINIEDD